MPQGKWKNPRCNDVDELDSKKQCRKAHGHDGLHEWWNETSRQVWSSFEGKVGRKGAK